MLDARRKQIEDALFPEGAEEVKFHRHSAPLYELMDQRPSPGEWQSMSRTKKTKDNKSRFVISINNDTEAVLREQRFKAFNAFSLSDMMEFQVQVEQVAELQPEEEEDVTWSVVKAVRMIARQSVTAHQSMRDSGTLGQNGEVYKTYNFLRVIYLVMWRVAFDSSSAESFFRTYARDFAKQVRGCPGMMPNYKGWSDNTASSTSKKLRCLFCGKAGHLSGSAHHEAEIAAGSAAYSQTRLKNALAEVSRDKALKADAKKRWANRIREYYASMSTGDAGSAES